MSKWLKTVTAFLYVTTQLAALVWVTISYAIAAYSTVKLQTPFPVETLSSQAITTILGVVIAKTVGNIFEHNSGVVFGKSDTQHDESEVRP